MELLISVDVEDIGDIYAKFIHLGSCVCYIQSISLLNVADSFHVSCKTTFAFGFISLQLLLLLFLYADL